MLYQLTTGELPHNTQAQVRRHAPFPKPSEVNQRISPVLENVILTCLRRDPGERFSSVGALQDAFSQASQHQLEYEPTPHLAAAGQGTIDWSTEVLQAMEQGHFGRAAQAAEQERRRSGDINALALQLNALFRDKRWTAFASLFEEVATTTELDGDSGAGIRLQAIRVYLKLRDLDKASSLLEASRVKGEMGLEHGLCEASIAGMQANYENARALLEDLNRSFPRNIQVLSRLVQVCEQQRDYQASAGFLRVALKLSPNDEKLSEKRNRYQALGAW
jgi:serine/threonine-protein kinase